MGLTDYNYMKSEQDYYETAYRGYLTIPVPNPSSDDFVSRYLGYNSYDISNDQLMIADGKGNYVVNPNANLRYHDDWKKEMMRTGFKQEYNLSSANEGKVGQYYLSAGYLNDQGYVKNTGFERFSSSFNGSVNVLPWLKAGLHAMGTISDQDFIDAESTQENPFYVYRNIAPIYPVYSRDNRGEKLIDPATGKPLYDYGDSRPFANKQNMVSSLLENTRRNKNNTFLLNPYLEASFMNQFTVNASYQLNNTYNDILSERTFRDQSIYRQTNKISNQLNSISFILNAEWNKTFERHNLKLDVGYESNTLKDTKQINVFDDNGNNYYPPELKDQYSIEDFKGSLTYSYRKKYLLSSAINRERANYSLGDKYNTYWALGLTYKLHEETFLKTASWINLLQIGGNYGLQGFKKYEQSYGSVYYNIRKPIKQFSTKLELVAFNNKLSFTTELYKKKGLSNLPIPLSPNPVLEFNTQNTGIEVSLGALLMTHKDFQWYTHLNMTHNKNKLVDLPLNSGNFGVYKEGSSILDIYLPEYAGVDPNNGQPLYYKGEGKTSDYASLTSNDFKYHVSPLPSFYGSLTNNLRYKQFELSIQLNYSVGGKYYDVIYADLMNNGQGENNAEDMKNAWTPQNTATTIPKENPFNPYLTAQSSRFVRNASYLSLKRATLSYNIAPAALQKARLKNLKIYLAGDNLFLLADKKGMNPQSTFLSYRGYAYSPARSIILGINIGL